MRTWIESILVLFTLMLPLTSASASDGGSTFILSVGEDQSFDPHLKRLRFSSLDSKRFARAMEIVSEVPNERIQLMNNITASEFRTTTAHIAQSLRGNKAIKRFILFFSGHSDERGLHFRDGLFTKEELHSFLRTVPTQTKISILDSCYSGALAAKGIEPAVSEFTIPKSDFDEPTGTVFLTASSADEGAFESSRFESSVFSNYLVSGLYGSADLNNDGLVTIDELYQFIYQRTRYDNLMLPQSVQQQPEFVSRLHGRGALVLSTPKSTLQTLQIDPKIKGEIRLQATYGLRSYILTADDRIQNTIRLPSGEYNFSVQKGQSVGQTSFKLQPNRATSVMLADLEWNNIRVGDGNRKGYTAENEVDAPQKKIAEPTLPPPTISASDLAASQTGMNGSIKAHPTDKSYAPLVSLGAHSGYFEHEDIGPLFEVALIKLPWERGLIDFAPYVDALIHTHELRGYNNEGTDTAASLLLGTRLMFDTHSFLPERMTAFLSGGYGISHIETKWNAGGTHQFSNANIPVGHLGFGFQERIFASGGSVGFNYRRELASINDKRYGKSELSGDIYTLSIVY